MREKAIKIGLGIFLFGSPLVILAYAFDITIPCFYYNQFGIKCPGCGVTRMFRSMMHLDFSTAFSYNPVMFVMFFVWLLVWILCIWDKFEFVRKKVFIKGVVWVSVIVTIVFALVRNFV